MTDITTYSIGTASVTNGGTTITFSGAILGGGNATSGDLIKIGSNAFVPILSITDDTHVVISAWPGSTVSGAGYVIFHVSPLRFEGGEQTAEVTKLVRTINQAGYFYFVSGAAPDPNIGDEGQYALKTNTGAWVLWYKTGGVWVLQGTPVGLTYKGNWSSATAYVVNDRVSRSGATYIAKQASTNQDPATDVSNTYWDAGGLRGDDGINGATWFSGSGVPSDGSGVNGDFYFRTSTSDVYKKASGTWSIVANIKGVIGLTPVIAADSASVVTVGVGSKSFAISLGTAFYPGMRVRASNGDKSRVLIGDVISNVSGTLIVNVDDTVGTGSDSAWNINVTGLRGIQGSTGPQGNTGVQGAKGDTPIVAGTSVTSVPVGTGSKSLTVETGLSFAAGMRLRVQNSDASKVMLGFATAYVPSTGALTMSVQSAIGSGSGSAWQVTITGGDGPQGVQGDQGQGITPGATGTLAQRSTYDGQGTGFVYLETDVAPFRLWVKASNVSADWAGPSYVSGIAATGDFGLITDSILDQFDYGGIAA